MSERDLESQISRMAQAAHLADQLAEVGYTPGQLIELVLLANGLLFLIGDKLDAELASLDGSPPDEITVGMLQRIRDAIRLMQDDDTIDDRYNKAFMFILGVEVES